jgi:ATP-dependent RNA helicase DDX3X
MSKAPTNYNWASSRRRFEWKDEYEQQGFVPRDEALEMELFGVENHVHAGINFAKYDTIPVRVIGENPPSNFENVRSVRSITYTDTLLYSLMMPTFTLV